MIAAIQNVKRRIDQYCEHKRYVALNPFEFFLKKENDRAFFEHHATQIREEIVWLSLIPSDKNGIAGYIPVREARQQAIFNALNRHQDMYKHVLQHQKSYERTAKKHLAHYFSIWHQFEKEIARHDPSWMPM